MKKSSIFLSYASVNETEAKALKAKLEKAGFEVWFAPEAIKPGDSYSSKIVEAVETCDAFVVMLSHAANNSAFVRSEVERAFSYQKPIYPLRIEDVMPSKDLELFLSMKQWSDGMSAQAIESFVNAMAEKFGLVKRFESDVDAADVSSLCTQHFKQMGYKIFSSNTQIVQQRPEIQACLEAKVSLEGLESMLLALDEQKAHFIIPIYRPYVTPIYLKGLEVELFWEHRFHLWKPEFHDELRQQFPIYDDAEKMNFNTKLAIMHYYRSLGWKEQQERVMLPILFYLFIKEPPVYGMPTYAIPFKGTYSSEERLPHVLINYAMLPQWWGVGKDDIDGIGSRELYKGFLEGYETLMKSGEFLQHSHDRAMYENYNGRLAESVCEVYLKKHQLIVQRHGVEHLLGNSLALLGGKGTGEDTQAIAKITRFMSSPDFLVLKLDDQQRIVNAYYMDAKWREFKNEDACKRALSKGGELFKHAQKYAQNWDDVYLFMIAVFKESKEIKAYMLSVQEIVEGSAELSSIAQKAPFNWIDPVLTKELLQWAKRIWL